MWTVLSQQMADKQQFSCKLGNYVGSLYEDHFGYTVSLSLWS
jgi:hypothetical protein